MSANKPACASCSEAMRRNILSDVLSADGRVSWPLPQQLAPGRLSTETMSDTILQIAETNANTCALRPPLLELQRRPFNVGVCPRFVGSMPLTSKHIDGEAGGKPTALTSTPAIQARRFLLDEFEDLGPNERWKRRRS